VGGENNPKSNQNRFTQELLIAYTASDQRKPQLTIKSDERPVLLSINGRGFYVLHYSAIPEHRLTRISFDLVDPNTGEGGSADAVVDPKLLEDLNSYNLGTAKGQAFLIWIETSSNEVRWQLRKNVKSETRSFNPP
jgi:hypothetical protein